MRTIITTILLLLSLVSRGQFDPENIEYWTGQGTSTAYIAVDFNDGNTFESYTFAHRYNPDEVLTIKDLLNSFQSADSSIEISFYNEAVTNKVYIDNITYNSQSMTKGVTWQGGNGGYWNVWGGGFNSFDEFISLNGDNIPVNNQLWYGFSYDVSEPTPPNNLVTALDPYYFDTLDFTWEVGTGDSYVYFAMNFGHINHIPIWKVNFDNSGWGTNPATILYILVENNILARTTAYPFDNGTYYYNYNGVTNSVHIDDRFVFTGTNYTEQQLGYLGTTVPHNGFIAISQCDMCRIHFVDVVPYNTMSVETHNLDISIYPNPVKDILYFEKEVQKVIVTDLTGKVLSVQSNSTQIDMSSFQNGVYLVVIEQENGTKETNKIIKQ